MVVFSFLVVLIAARQMTWIDFIALGLAAGVPINTWLHPGGLFEEAVEWLRVWAEFVPTDANPKPRLKDKIRSKLGQLATCPFCLSHHTPWILLLLFFVPSLWLSSPWDVIFKLPIYSMAATQITLIVFHFVKDSDE